jgi:CHAT domain-containing protein
LERSYVALVLLPGGAMKHVVLGTGVEKQVEEFRAQVGRKKSRRLNGKSPAEVAEKQAAQQAAQALHALIMKPLAAVLGESRKLYLSVDYQLNLVPFWALYDPEKGQYLIDSDYRFVYLTTGRDLLKADVPNEAIRPQRVAVFAVPQLAKDGGWSSDANGKLKTNQDLQAVKKQFPNALPFTGAWFSKAELLHQKEPPAILHVASHGSFVSNRAARASAEAAGSPAGERDLSLERDCVTPSTDPMLNLRIALSGAKRYCAAGDPSAGTGYATATDLSTMDLRGTQLVVLAAGETGLGTEKPGQGVYGMRRALTLAGSETQILSLWNAYDPAAGLLWTKYYKRLHAGADRVEALRASARELKATPGMEHPYYWGVFIAAGKDGPLRDVQEIASYKDPEALRLAGKAPGGLREVRSSKVVQSPRGRLASGRAPRSAKRPAL